MAHCQRKADGPPPLTGARVAKVVAPDLRVRLGTVAHHDKTVAASTRLRTYNSPKILAEKGPSRLRADPAAPDRPKVIPATITASPRSLRCPPPT